MGVFWYLEGDLKEVFLLEKMHIMHTVQLYKNKKASQFSIKKKGKLSIGLTT